jgi:hypothetical protein
MALDSAWTDRHQPIYLDIFLPDLAGYDGLPLARIRVLQPFEAVGHGLVEPAMDLKDVSRSGNGLLQAALIDPYLHRDVGAVDRLVHPAFPGVSGAYTLDREAGRAGSHIGFGISIPGICDSASC